jgi:Zn-dependent protease
MRLVRMLVSWVFFAGACGAAVGFVRLVLAVLHPKRVDDPHLFYHSLPLLVFFLVPTIVFSAAWWTTLREKPSARAWGLAACALLVSIQFLSLLYFIRTAHNPRALTDLWHIDGLVFVVSVAGFVAYGRRFKQPDEATRHEASNPLLGDGTFGPLNRYVVVAAPVAFYFLYSWLSSFMRDRGLWDGQDFISDNLYFLTILAAVILIHELGHAIAAAALGMQFTSFTLGPLRLQREKCRWKFSFEFKMCLKRAGAVGALPKTAKPPRWHGACVAVAGPAANLLSSVVVLLAYAATDIGQWTMIDGYIVLFGATSFFYAAINLIPLRVGQLYSDGARFYQSVANNAFCDLMRIRQTVMVMPETALRPRDYDIEAIERALVGFPAGVEGHYLKLYVHEYCLENGHLEEARVALTEAEAIYGQSALKEGTEVTFILGYALFRDGDSARRWWDRLETRKADRSDSDYWLAKSAVDCVEGRLEEADSALRKADALIVTKPLTGSRAFDADWSVRLRQMMGDMVELARN